MQRLLLVTAAVAAACQGPVPSQLADNLVPPCRDPFGVDIEEINEAYLDAELDRAAESGAQWVRFLAMWRWTEYDAPVRNPQPNTPGQWAGQHTYYFDHLDKLVDGSRARGMQVYLTVIWPPAWANGNPNDCNPIVPTDCPDLSGGYVITNKLDLQDFYFNLADHFRGRVTYYGVWNEPNLRNMFNPAGDDAHYLELFVDRYLDTAFTGIRAGDPDAKIVAPELSDRCGIPSTCAAKTGWLTSWLTPLWQNHRDKFDVVSVHRYDRDSMTATAALETTFAQVGREKPIWLTEAGWNSTDEDFQSRQVCGLFLDNLARGSWWQRTFLHVLVDDPGNEQSFGIAHSRAFTAPFAPKPAFQTFHSLAGGATQCAR